MSNKVEVEKKAPREVCQQKYNSARIDLIVMVGLTVLNVVLAFTGSDSMMLFSAIVPYVAAIWSSMPEFAPVMIPLIAIAVISIAAYFICWILSKKHYGFMIAALCMFVLDTLALIGMYILMGDFSGILDFVIHALVLYYLIVGVINGIKLRKMPEEIEEEPIPVATLNGEAIETTQETKIN